jgi:hypothetical protein
MESESVLILVFIFIIFIALIIIGVLYFIYNSNYNDSNSFYKRKIERSLEKKLFDEEIDYNKLAQNNNFSNILKNTASIYSDDQLNKINKENKDYTLREIESNIPILAQRNYYKNTYGLIHNDDSNLSTLYNLDFNDNKAVYNKLNELHKIYDIGSQSNIKTYKNINSNMDLLQGYQKYYDYNTADTLKITSNLQTNNLTTNNLTTTNSITTSNFTVTNLQICNKAAIPKCFDLSVNNDGVLVGKPNSQIGPILSDTPFVFGKIDTASNPNTSNLYIQTGTVYNAYSTF